MDKQKRAYGLILLLMFPLVGVFGMIFILLGSSLNPQETPDASYPTPVSLLRPSVTFAPVLDNPAPTTSIKDFDGNSFNLAEFQGQIVVVNFWATWCAPCVREMPALQEFARENPEVVILSITDPNDGQTVEDIQAFIEKYELTDVQIGLDEQSRLKGFMSVVNLPTTYILDEEGVVRFRQIGEITLDDLDYYLDELS